MDINLKGLLSTIVSEKSITVNLYNEKNLLLISFVLPGFSCLEDVYEEDPVTRIEIKSTNVLNITIDTSNNI